MRYGAGARRVQPGFRDVGLSTLSDLRGDLLDRMIDALEQRYDLSEGFGRIAVVHAFILPVRATLLALLLELRAFPRHRADRLYSPV